MHIPSPARLVLFAAALAICAGLVPSASAQTQPAAALATTSVVVTVNVLANRHPISPYIYGASFPPSTAYIKTGGVTLSRWGGNNASRYNWKLNATNLDADWYFENYTWGSASSATYIQQAVAGGAAPIMTIPMLHWVAKDTSSNSFSVKKYGAQCSTDYWRPDAGNGVLPDCSTDLTGNDPSDAHTHLLDAPSASDPPGSVYRSQWIQAIAPDYGAQPHLYQLDNEPEIWSGTHRDVHPSPVGYDELAADIVHAGHVIKKYDNAAVRLAPVFDSWWFYWNGADNNDKGDHGGMDFLPWLLNEIWCNDQVLGSRSFDIFDVHAYFNGPDNLGSLSTAQKQAAALRATRDWWDPRYVSESGAVNQNWATFTQPNKTVAFVIPRMRALANSIYPGTPLSITEWNGAWAGESDFSTALVDADAYGILGKMRVWGASRWTAAGASTPAYKAIQLYRTANGSNSFAPISVYAGSAANPNSFSVYASAGTSGNSLTLMVVNKDPAKQAGVTFNLEGFDASTMKTFTLSQAKPVTIVASKSQPWAATQTFAPYSATLIVVQGQNVHTVAAEWDLNPDTLLAPTSGTVTIHPTITGGNGSVTLTSATGSGGMTLSITGKQLTELANGAIVIRTPANPGLYSFTVAGRDSAGTTQTQQGWVIATVPASTIAKTGDKQTARAGSKITLTATFVQGASGSTGATAGNVDILFTASAGTLSKRIVRTQSNGEATVQLTLPSKPGPVTVTALGPVFWGAPTATFTETAQ